MKVYFCTNLAFLELKMSCERDRKKRTFGHHLRFASTQINKFFFKKYIQMSTMNEKWGKTLANIINK